MQWRGRLEGGVGLRPSVAPPPGELMIVDGLEMGAQALLVPGEAAGAHVLQEGGDPPQLGLPQRPLVLVLEQDDPRQAHLLGEGGGRLPAGGELGPQLDDAVGEGVDGAIQGQVGEQPHCGGEDQMLAGRALQDVLEPVLERLVPLGGDPVDGPLRPPPLPGGLDRLDPPGRLELLDGPVEGAGPALGVVLVPLVHQPLHLVGVERAFAEQGEGGQGDHPMRRTLDALRHIALCTIAHGTQAWQAAAGVPAPPCAAA